MGSLRPAGATAGRLLAAVALGIAVGCASTPDPPGFEDTTDAGVVHVLGPGENLYRLSRYYGVSVEEIVRANGIGDVTQLPIGQRLWIPNAQRRAPETSVAPAGGSSSHAATRSESGLAWVWPVHGRLSSEFGGRRGGRHEGIDIRAQRGTPILAAEAGRVIHSGTGLKDYGRLVIVKHVGRYSTLYAHNQRNLVKKGDFVEKGDVIAEVGSTGNATGPHVHFELRRDRQPVDPLPHLP
jgi:lipoprotein NlpD